MGVIISRLVFVAGILAALAIMSGGLLYRHAGVELGTAFSVVSWGVMAGAGATVALAVLWVIVAAVSRSGAGLLLVVVGVVAALGTAFPTFQMRMKAAQLPVIHDITTDTANPPVFVAIAPVRANAPNGVDYATDPSLQLKAYPDIKTYVSPLPPASLFENALSVAHSMNWSVVSSSREEGRIEATDTTLWWGFQDDVVIRIVADGTGSKLDIRSMSRVGKSDIGKNADRIRAFLDQLSKLK